MRARAGAAAVVLVLAALLVGALPAGPAAACSCAGLSTASSFARADAVFTGTLLSREVSHPDAPVMSSGDPAVHVFAVDTVLKGDVHEQQGVVSADSGASCGLELSGEGPFAVFAVAGTDGGYTADLCGGTAPLTPELLAELRRLGGTAAPASSAPLPGAAGTSAAGPGDGARELRSWLVGGGGVLLVAAVGLTIARLRRPRG